MRIALVDQYTDEELKQILKQSNSMREFVSKLGYKSLSGDSVNLIKKRIENLDTSHFKFQKGIKRTVDNIFIKDSTAKGSVLRRWYKKGNYTPYKCSICGQEPLWNGKELTLILDHINGINNDHRLENLRWVCPNCNMQLDTTNGKNKKVHKKQYYCIDCGKLISRGATRCKDCVKKNTVVKHTKKERKYIRKTINKNKYFCVDCGKNVAKGTVRCKDCENKFRIASHTEELKHRQDINGNIVNINRESLKQLIRNKPFLQIGQEFGVSDNAIRKWCKKFNLPTHSREIKVYTDEEWKLI